MSSVDGKCSIFVYNKERPPAKCGRQIGENMVCMKHLEKDVWIAYFVQMLSLESRNTLLSPVFAQYVS